MTLPSIESVEKRVKPELVVIRICNLINSGVGFIHFKIRITKTYYHFKISINVLVFKRASSSRTLGQACINRRKPNSSSPSWGSTHPCQNRGKLLSSPSNIWMMIRSWGLERILIYTFPLFYMFSLFPRKFPHFSFNGWKISTSAHDHNCAKHVLAVKEWS